MTNLSENVKPMLRLFFIVAYIYFLFMGHLTSRIISSMPWLRYQYYNIHRYVAIRATKPTIGDEHTAEPKKVQ
ncbi:hypothetical protein PEX1_084330 [Penicillium expansum]|uniref:Uncharacterized protein n=1 Tax=Penicillium expansum TaxID=27334 RepID=A0A0A2KKN4_PENEN|nr:hypothetical protein PEX2_058360 [Penicillium expansum]KGO40043.1 hypothetical protein PEXP_034260 [Penicillium expansum]KGO53193.1 hypothetical protein PEX2_058360 [Penicillium expansum]KGO68377.1 hypothetical protein PEX1_084330 [Penicillium expansum]